MEEQYVSFETAKMLKDVGFEADVSSRYIKEEPDDEYWCFFDRGIKRDDYNTYIDSITCPTQALAARWLREKYGLNICCCLNFVGEAFHYLIQSFIDNKHYENIFSNETYIKYEDAMEAGLQEAIEMVKRRYKE